jgi:hypothetical protein
VGAVWTPLFCSYMSRRSFPFVPTRTSPPQLSLAVDIPLRQASSSATCRHLVHLLQREWSLSRAGWAPRASLHICDQRTPFVAEATLPPKRNPPIDISRRSALSTSTSGEPTHQFERESSHWLKNADYRAFIPCQPVPISGAKWITPRSCVRYESSSPSRFFARSV